MEAYFIRDKDSQGGTYEIYRTQPTDETIRKTVVEIRKGDFPAETWLQIGFAEIQPDPFNHYDELILPHWEKAELFWTREGGYVNV